MITIPTVFILGAGASKSYGFPTGAELRKDIIRNCVDRLLYFKNLVPPSYQAQATKFVDAFT